MSLMDMPAIFCCLGKLAEIATPEAIMKVQSAAEKKIQKEKEELEKNQKLAEALDGREIVIRAKAEEGKLFGSITAKDIVKVLKEQEIEIGEKNIDLIDPIKEIGEKEVIVQFDHGIEAKIRVIVEAE